MEKWEFDNLFMLKKLPSESIGVSPVNQLVVRMKWVKGEYLDSNPVNN